MNGRRTIELDGRSGKRVPKIEGDGQQDRWNSLYRKHKDIKM